MRSTIVARAAGGQGVEPPLHPRGVVVLTRATLPAVPDMLMGEGSVTSGAGRGLPTGAFEASCIKRYAPGANDPARGVIWVGVAPKLPAPVALAYWTDQPVRETVALPRLKSSTKS